MALASLQPGDPARVGRYRLGSGGMGVVYLGVAKDGSQVAVKVLRPEMASDPEFRARFSRAIASSGNTNISELNDSVVNNLFTQSASARGAARTAIWSQIDEQVMKDAAILPGIYAKTVLYRPPQLTNVYVQAYYGMYNYAVLGISSGSSSGS